MIPTFILTTRFEKWVAKHLPPASQLELQRELLENPGRGNVMPGCGGLRKVRVADPKRQKGKRGGLRVIYLHVQEVDRFLLLDGYGKNEKDDLSAQEKKELRMLAAQFKAEIIEAVRREDTKESNEQ